MLGRVCKRILVFWKFILLNKLLNLVKYKLLNVVDFFFCENFVFIIIIMVVLKIELKNKFDNIFFDKGKIYYICMYNSVCYFFLLKV